MAASDPIRLVADVHDAAQPLADVAALGGNLIVLGDLLNWIDYRDNDGIVARVCGRDFVAELVSLRAGGKIEEAHRLWIDHAADRVDDLRRQHDEEVSASYARLGAALSGCSAFVIHGNADRPAELIKHLPATARYIDFGVLDIAGISFGFVSGGLPVEAGVPVPGESAEDEIREKLRRVGAVQILCTHIPPAIQPLQTDVIGGRQRGSVAVLEYLTTHQPRFHFFGDVHQPQAVTWKVGRTVCWNVGYFRATGRPYTLMT